MDCRVTGVKQVQHTPTKLQQRHLVSRPAVVENFFSVFHVDSAEFKKDYLEQRVLIVFYNAF